MCNANLSCTHEAAAIYGFICAVTVSGSQWPTPLFVPLNSTLEISCKLNITAPSWTINSPTLHLENIQFSVDGGQIYLLNENGFYRPDETVVIVNNTANKNETVITCKKFSPPAKSLETTLFVLGMSISLQSY